MRRLLAFAFRSKKRAALSTIALLLLSSAVAYAAWTISAIGTDVSRGKTGAALTTPTLTAPGFAAMTGDCIPGGNCALNVIASHNNGTSLKATGVTFATTGTISTDVGACSGSNFTFNSGKQGVLIALSPQPSIPAGTPTLISVPAVLQMSTAAPQACANAEIRFSGTATVDFSTP